MHPSKIIVLVISIGLVVLGIWLMFQGTDGAAVGAAPGSPTTVNAPQTQTANPAVLGLALIAGGVLTLFMAFRR